MSSARKAPSPTVVIFGRSSTVEASTSRPDRGTERPQPHRRDEARVEREQQRAGRVQQPLGGPHLPPDPGADGEGARSDPEAEEPHAHEREQRPASGSPPASPAGTASSAAMVASPRSSAPSTARPSTTAATAAATTGKRRHRPPTTSPKATSHRAPRAGAWSGQLRRGLPAGRAGEPDQRARGRHTTDHRRARLDLGAVAHPGAGEQRAARAHGGVGADVHAARGGGGRRRASSPRGRPPARSRRPSPRVSRPVTGGRLCRSTPAADRGAQRTGERGDPRRAGQVGRPRGVDQLVGGPQPHVHRTAARVDARPDAEQEQPSADDGDGHAAERRDEDDHARPRPTTTTPAPPTAGRSRAANTLLRSASHTSQRAPTTVWRPRVSTVSSSWVRRDVGTTHSRSSGSGTSAPSPEASRCSASAARRG